MREGSNLQPKNLDKRRIHQWVWADWRPATPDHPLPSQGPAVARERSEPDELGDLFGGLVRNVTKGREYRMSHALSRRQVAMLLAGSLVSCSANGASCPDQAGSSFERGSRRRTFHTYRCGYMSDERILVAEALNLADLRGFTVGGT